MTEIHLVDLLPGCRLEAASPDHVSCQTVSLGLERRAAIFQHPDSRLSFPPLALAGPGRFEALAGMKSFAWARHASPVLLAVRYRRQPGPWTVLASITLDPRRDPTHRGWLPLAADLPAGSDAVELELVARIPDGGSNAYAWTCWGEPRLLGVAPPRRARPRPHPNVVLITADALRRDHLGCFGHPRVRTPHLDALAADGIAVEGARSASPSTLASYASTLTGRLPAGHGIDAEWGRLGPLAASLPELLERAGFQTLLAASEAELSLEATGLPGLFSARLPTLGRPAQPGAITTRSFLRWLDQDRSRPFFAWLEYFDTHPPSLAPPPWRDLYYSGDPRRRPSPPVPFELARINGVESVAGIDLALPWLRAGRVDDELAYRLAQTARNLAGEPGTGPDLAAHLLALGPSSWAHPDRGRFVRWLADRAEGLALGRMVDPDLVAWLERIRSALLPIEADILSWLDGVEDPRFALAQYEASVSYFDSQVGEVVARLKDDGLYDSTTVIVTSPHGELLGEGGVWFHHHTLLEAALALPLLIKPGRSAAGAPIAFRTGSRPTGVFDMVDLLPTLARMLGLAAPDGLDGVCRWDQLASGGALPPHPSFAAGLGHILLSVHDGERTLLAARGGTRLSDRWEFARGERRLVDPRGDERVDLSSREPARARHLADLLEARAAAWGYPLPGTG